MKKLIGLFMLLLIFSNTVSFICTLESSLAKFTEETFQNLTFKENETKNIEDYLYRVLQERNKSAQWKHVSDPPKQSLNSYDSRGDWWSFNDTSQWRDSVYVNGDKIRLIVGVKRDKPTDFVALENIVAKHKATIVNTISIKGEIVAVVVELPLNSVSAFVEETRSIELTSYIEPNMKVQAQFIPNDPYWGWQWDHKKWRLTGPGTPQPALTMLSWRLLTQAFIIIMRI